MTTKLLLTVLTVLTVASSLYAQDPQRPPQGKDGKGGQGGQKGPPPGREGGPGGGGGGEGFRPPMHPLQQALDANGDGIIDAKELANAVAALKKLDKNGDGKLTEDEYRPARPQGGQGGPGGQGGFGGQRGAPGQGGGPGEKGGEPRRPEGQPGGGGGPGDKAGGEADFVTRLFQNDKNKDGKLTKDELPEAMQSIFVSADTNKDGAIDRKEAAALAERMKQRGGGQGQGTEGKRPPLEK
ncbi:MAG: hypothetical protein RL514_4185 [Verrucomicrobiota bacterium]|jgi:hypothetical protein